MPSRLAGIGREKGSQTCEAVAGNATGADQFGQALLQLAAQQLRAPRDLLEKAGAMLADVCFDTRGEGTQRCFVRRTDRVSRPCEGIPDILILALQQRDGCALDRPWLA